MYDICLFVMLNVFHAPKKVTNTEDRVDAGIPGEDGSIIFVITVLTAL